jgi:hypothetical protein
MRVHGAPPPLFFVVMIATEATNAVAACIREHVPQWVDDIWQPRQQAAAALEHQLTVPCLTHTQAFVHRHLGDGVCFERPAKAIMKELRKHTFATSEDRCRAQEIVEEWNRLMDKMYLVNMTLIQRQDLFRQRSWETDSGRWMLDANSLFQRNPYWQLPLSRLLRHLSPSPPLSKATIQQQPPSPIETRALLQSWTTVAQEAVTDAGTFVEWSAMQELVRILDRVDRRMRTEAFDLEHFRTNCFADLDTSRPVSSVVMADTTLVANVWTAFCHHGNVLHALEWERDRRSLVQWLETKGLHLLAFRPSMWQPVVEAAADAIGIRPNVPAVDTTQSLRALQTAHQQRTSHWLAWLTSQGDRPHVLQQWQDVQLAEWNVVRSMSAGPTFRPDVRAMRATVPRIAAPSSHMPVSIEHCPWREAWADSREHEGEDAKELEPSAMRLVLERWIPRQKRITAQLTAVSLPVAIRTTLDRLSVTSVDHPRLCSAKEWWRWVADIVYLVNWHEAVAKLGLAIESGVEREAAQLAVW